MNTPTYKEQFDKLTEAYIKLEVNPFQDCACFVGNLLNKTNAWIVGREFDGFDEYKHWTFRDNLYWDCITPANACVLKESNGLYSLKEIYDMEQVFMYTYVQNGGPKSKEPDFINEHALFLAFEAGLEKLKQIHESKGEIVDPQPFVKRQLQTV